jgi:hypothetical protein
MIRSRQARSARFKNFAEGVDIAYRSVIVLIQQYNSTLDQVRSIPMTKPNRPLSPIVPTLPEGDRRPTLLRPTRDNRGGIFAGWGPKL